MIPIGNNYDCHDILQELESIRINKNRYRIIDYNKDMAIFKNGKKSSEI